MNTCGTNGTARGELRKLAAALRVDNLIFATVDSEPLHRAYQLHLWAPPHWHLLVSCKKKNQAKEERHGLSESFARAPC